MTQTEHPDQGAGDGGTARRGRFSGNGIMARAVRGSTWVALAYIGGQGMRLASNLILTRLLFPEAFGLMTIVSVFMVGLVMFSDMGVTPAIMHSKRGDEPAFLDTAWTIQILRGGALWITACALSVPAAAFYGEPMLAQLLPVAGLSLLIAGFEPTRIDTAQRHLLMGRVTALDFLSQVISIASMLVIAVIHPTVWALIAGWIVGALARLGLMVVFLPGRANRPAWEREAASELIGFGFWIFLSTACGFLVAQGDKAILGKYLSMEGLGIYNIGFFLAAFPMLLGQSVTGRVLIPLYREHPIGAATRARLNRTRFFLTGGLMAALVVLAYGGAWIVGLLYDPRYGAAGGVLVVVAVVQMWQLVTLTYDQAALAAGDSRNFFWVTAIRAVAQTGLFLVGAHFGGLGGAMVGLGVATVLVYPAVVWLARRHEAWDPKHDFVFLGLAMVLGAGAAWFNIGVVRLLWEGSGIH